MSIPYVANALNGWTHNVRCQKVTKENNYGKITIVKSSPFILDMCIQPIPQEKINRQVYGNRSWKYKSLWVKGKPDLKTDDVIFVNDRNYRIETIIDWSEGGYMNYDVEEDYILE